MAKSAQTHKEADVDDKSQPALVPIDLTDVATVHRTLDDAVTEAAEAAAFQRTHMVEDVKLALGFTLVLIAGVAHILPGDFPHNYWQLAACVALYAAVSLISTLFSARFERESFLHLKASAEHGTPALRVRSKMPRYSTEYALHLEGGGRVFDTAEIDATAYFHEDGYLAEEKFKQWAETQLKAFKGKSSAASDKKAA